MSNQGSDLYISPRPHPGTGAQSLFSPGDTHLFPSLDPRAISTSLHGDIRRRPIPASRPVPTFPSVVGSLPSPGAAKRGGRRDGEGKAGRRKATQSSLALRGILRTLALQIELPVALFLALRGARGQQGDVGILFFALPC